MVTSAILTVFAAVVSAILGALPTIPVPSWVSGAGSAIGQVFAFADSMSPWFPTTLALLVAGALFAIKASSFAFYVLRKVVSLLTGGGGA